MVLVRGAEQLDEEDFFAWPSFRPRNYDCSTRPNLPLDLSHIAERSPILGTEGRSRYAAGSAGRSSICCSWTLPPPKIRAEAG
jgi:hypothetical protein